MKFNLTKLVRKNILELEAYKSARSDFEGEASVFLDANENSLGSVSEQNWNRYPDPMQVDLKQKLASIKGVQTEQIFIGNGSDEPIDLLYRIFCEPNASSVLSFSPTYGMYKVSASINAVNYKELPLAEDFAFPLENALKTLEQDKSIKLVFVCNPNNPTGNTFPANEIEKLLQNFAGIVVVDEAYIDFCPEKTFVNKLKKYPNLIVLQTFSKAYALAGLRVGVAYASQEIVTLFNKVKPPYNVNSFTQQEALKVLEQNDAVRLQIKELNKERENLKIALEANEKVERVFPSEANFLLVKFKENTSASELYKTLISQGIVVRNRSSVVPNTLRITVGTKKENEELLEALKKADLSYFSTGSK